MKKSKSTLPQDVTFQSKDTEKKVKIKKLKNKSKKERIEDVKSLAIVLLTLSIFYLTSQIDAFSNLNILQDEQQTTLYAYTQSSDQGMDFLPINMMAIRDNGTIREQIGVQYDKEEGEVFFDATSQLLKEALGNIDSVTKITEDVFLEEITSPPSLYFELFGHVPLDLLEKWLLSTSVQGNNGTTQRFALSLWQDNIAFFYQEDEKFYVCPVSILDPTRLDGILTQISGTPVSFAMEHPQLTRISPLTMLGGEPEETLHYTASSPFDHSSEVAYFLNLLDFPSSVNSQYVTDDAVVLRSNTDSIRLSYDGTVLYQVESTPRYVLPHSGNVITLQEQVEGCQLFIHNLFQHMSVIPDISLYEVELSEGDTLISYYFSLNGIPLVWNHDVIGGSFHLKGDEIHSFTLQYRQYLPTDQATPTLPLEQVQAILQGLGVNQWEVLFCYQDLGSDTVSAGWVVVS